MKFVDDDDDDDDDDLPITFRLTADRSSDQSDIDP